MNNLINMSDKDRIRRLELLIGEEWSEIIYPDFLIHLTFSELEIVELDEEMMLSENSKGGEVND